MADENENGNGDAKATNDYIAPAPSISEEASNPDEFSTAPSYDILIMQVIVRGGGAPAEKREIDSFSVGKDEFMRFARTPGFFKQHCEQNYKQRYGGGRYLFAIRDANTGKPREIARCMVDGPAEGVPGAQAQQGQQPAPQGAHFVIPAGAEGDVPTDMKSFLIWFTKTRIDEASKQAERLESELREQRRQNNDLLKTMLAAKNEGGLGAAAGQLTMLKSLIDITQGFGPREPSGAEIGLKLLESPAVQNLTQETLGVAKDLVSGWKATKGLEEGADVGAAEVKTNKGEVTAEMYARKLKELTQGKTPDDVIKSAVNEVLRVFAVQEKKVGKVAPPKQKLQQMFHGIRLMDMLKNSAFAINRFVLKGSKSSLDCAKYMVANVSEKTYLEWFKSQTYEQLIEVLAPYESVESLAPVVRFYRRADVGKVVREVLGYLNDPDKMKAQEAEKVPDFTEDDFAIDTGEKDDEAPGDEDRG